MSSTGVFVERLGDRTNQCDILVASCITTNATLCGHLLETQYRQLPTPTMTSTFSIMIMSVKERGKEPEKMIQRHPDTSGVLAEVEFDGYQGLVIGPSRLRYGAERRLLEHKSTSCLSWRGKNSQEDSLAHFESHPKLFVVIAVSFHKPR